MSIVCGAGIILLLLFNLTSTTYIRAIDTCLFHARARVEYGNIISRFENIFFSLLIYKTDSFTPLDRIFFRFAEAPTICASSRSIAKLHHLPTPFSFARSLLYSLSLFLCLLLSLCLSLYRILFLPRFSRTRLYRQGITAQQYLEKLSSFHQANSESNATPYNSIRRRRKKCKRKRSVV